LHREEDLARQLVQSLDAEQRAVAILPVAAPSDILNSPGQRDFTQPQGLPQKQMNAQQSALLVQLIREYLWRHRAEIAHAAWEKIEQVGLSEIHFAWAGAVDAGQPHYYRVQEAALCWSMTTLKTTATMCTAFGVIRKNDFGADLLREHLDAGHRHT
jgi:hypothetical protein